MKNIKKASLILFSSALVLLNGCKLEKESEIIPDTKPIETLDEEIKEVIIEIKKEEDLQEVVMPEIIIPEEKEEPIIVEIIPKVEKKEIVISAVGDCTLGSDPNFGYARTFHEVYDNNDASYFFKGVYDITSNDDITVANLETTFTESNDRLEKTFNFKGPKEYADILTQGSVEIVNLANNHSHDYKQKGYDDTISALTDVNIPYFASDDYYIYEVKGIKIGFFGYLLNQDLTEKVKNSINSLKENGADIIIGSFHWGHERDYSQNQYEIDLAHFAIDNGCDLVLGHHPHVVQGIENYNGKYIVYSLGNFCFGGNKNPNDKDTFIFQQKFNFENDILVDTSIEIIPASVSSVQNKNDYQPTVLEGEEKERVLTKILKYSNIEYK